MTAPWPLTEAKDAPEPGTLWAACHVCGGALPASGVIVAWPHAYHADCYRRFHAALNDRANLSKTIAEIRALVAEDVQKGAKA